MEKNNYIFRESSNEYIDDGEDFVQESNQFGGTTKYRDQDYKKGLWNYQQLDYFEESYRQNSLFSNNQAQDSFENSQPIENVEENKKMTLTYPQIQIKQPGETKNMPKCFGRQLQNTMKQIRDHTKDPKIKEMFEKSDVKKFLRTKSDDIGKKKLDDFIQSEIGQIIAQDFFGNCRWINGLVKENKTNVESYFRHNKIYFYESQKAKKTRLN